MLRLGYKYGTSKKDVYIDGHERSDVVQYRNEFTKIWIDLFDYMAFYSGELMDEVVPQDCKQATPK